MSIAMRSQPSKHARRRRGRLAAACAATVSLLLAGAAQAQTETTTVPDDTATTAAAAPAAETTPAPAAAPSAPKGLRLTEARARPRLAYLYGAKRMRFAIQLNASAPVNVRIDIVRKNRTIERSLNALVNPRTRAIVPWDGLNNLGVAVRGKFSFIVRGPGGKPIPFAKRYARGKAGPKVRFGLYDHIFPVRGKHSYGDGIGAPRGDHTHQGLDISAACGTKLVPAQGGTVQVNAFQAGGAGYYVVIDTHGSGIDHVYMHLAGPPPVAVGQSVPTGLYFAQVGNTGSSSGCHLHFEMWSAPGWYEGGTFMDPVPFMRAWDKYS
jgi:murein DD-endopeptidase MepM/ murein hydrolase activator NlpD